MTVILEGKNEFLDELQAKKEAASVAAFNIVTKGRLIVGTKARKTFRPFPGGRKISQNPPWNPAFKSHIGRAYYVFIPPFQAEPPNPTNRSGHLSKSIIGGPVTKTGEGSWAGSVGTILNYAKYVEFGTKRMTKEPFLETGLRNSAEDLQALAEAEWERAWHE
jgi:HK97 gp10 family phage protein